MTKLIDLDKDQLDLMRDQLDKIPKPASQTVSRDLPAIPPAYLKPASQVITHQASHADIKTPGHANKVRYFFRGIMAGRGVEINEQGAML